MVHTPDDSLRSLLGKQVVLDTEGPLLYIGTLLSIDDDSVTLIDAEVYDRNEAHSTKESYLAGIREIGFQPNRRRLFVRRSAVISISSLDDVITQ